MINIIFRLTSAFAFVMHFSYNLAYMYTRQITLNQTAPTGADALDNSRYTGQAHLFGLAANYQF